MKQPSVLDVELERLVAEYQHIDASTTMVERYSLFNASACLLSQSLERHILTLLKLHHVTGLAEKKLLDVGCGKGGTLQNFIRYGARPENLSGIDLMEHRIEHARTLNAAIDWRVGSAHQLPYPDASFDLVLSFVLFSSILEESLRQQIADEMWRVRKPGGLLLCYDFAYSNPRNPAVRGIPRTQVQQLFHRPGALFTFQRLALAPPISRLVAPHSYTLAYMLERLNILNTHIIGIISLKDDSHH